jgi:phage shock protein E
MRAMAFGFLLSISAAQAAEPNPAIDQQQYLRDALAAIDTRGERRLDLEDFLRAAKQPDTVLLDARSREAFALRHVRGAVNLPYTEFNEQALADVIGPNSVRVLIYCNNNFRADPRAFPTKRPAASLNLATFTALASYGYRNVYELAPQLEVGDPRVPFAGSLASAN